MRYRWLSFGSCWVVGGEAETSSRSWSPSWGYHSVSCSYINILQPRLRWMGVGQIKINQELGSSMESARTFTVRCNSTHNALDSSYRSPHSYAGFLHQVTDEYWVPLTSVAINSGNSDAADSGGSPLGKEKEPPPLDPPT
ncbi:hypothetical protein HF086_008419 [Spodoptera exigua]|uniref:Uncharacterized protein n=1 Tax=Spodoptera exigua TaxID=7107 RepID=A0A922MG83_SPOEX|nr:hypothetical protein HF086_008419 [Spodoptera exigua]